MVKQIFLIHGGMTFRKYEDYLSYLKSIEINLDKKSSWSKDYLDKNLEEFQIIRPMMPSGLNAKYVEWEIMFENYVKIMEDEVILIGNSLGSIFLAKYLSENNFSKKIKCLYLVCAPFDNSLPGEELAGGFELEENLNLLEENCQKIIFYFSKDDKVVPLSHAEKYKKKLPLAKIEILEGKNGHFEVEEFPELINSIKNL